MFLLYESEDEVGTVQVSEVISIFKCLYVYSFPRFLVHPALCRILQCHLVVYLQIYREFNNQIHECLRTHSETTPSHRLIKVSRLCIELESWLRLTFSTYWASISFRVSFVIDRDWTFLRTSSSSSSYLLFFEAWNFEISFKTSYTAYVASGTYLPFNRDFIRMYQWQQ